MKVILDQEDRDKLMASLLDERRGQFVNDYVKRGKRTAFARELAKSKGVHITDTMTEEEIERFIDDWILVDFMDMGPGYQTKGMTCACGRTLRYVYIVFHKESKQRLQLGKEHFEEHTMIPAGAVKQILQGMAAIDYELDELLLKLHDNWRLQHAFPHLPSGFTMPAEMEEQLAIGLPLLDRQIEKLRLMIRRMEENIPVSSHASPRPADLSPTTNKLKIVGLSAPAHDKKEDEPLQFAFDFQLDDDLSITGASVSDAAAIENEMPVHPSQSSFQPAPSSKPLRTQINQSIVRTYINEGMQSARAIAELLISKHGYLDKRFVTGKPTLYPELCTLLDQLVQQGEAVLVHAEPSRDDRIYGRAK